MKKYVTIKMEATEAEHLEKWIQNSLLLAEKIRPKDKKNTWFKKILEIVKKREPAED